jgi:predicted nuclease with TOPRIM domain
LTGQEEGQEDKDESLWSEDDTEGPGESPSSIVQKLTWENHELRNTITNLQQEIRDLTRRTKELEEIEVKRVEAHDFKRAITMATTATAAPANDITVPASLFPKFVIASHGATQLFLKVQEGTAKEVVKK